MLRRNLKKTVAVLLVLSIFIAVFNLTDFSLKTKNFFFWISAPIQGSLWQAGRNVSDFFAGMFMAGDLRKEVERIRFENQKLLVRLAGLTDLEKENEFLRETLGLGMENDFELIMARVTSKDISRDSVLINKGERDGISEGMAVITEQKVILGRIGLVYDRFAEVILITNKDSSFGARMPERGLDGVAKGKGSSNLSLELIPREKDVFENDAVVTSVLGGVYPQGLLVGQVETVKKSDVDPFQSATIKLAFDINRLDYVLVVNADG